MQEDREGPMFPFWASLALEFLARATLAKVHPALLADPQDGDNILYACGVGLTARPKSIPVKTVFARCHKIVAGFTKSEFETCMSLAERRNDELHSGHPGFDDLPPGTWLAKYFRICNLLLEFQGRTLSNILPIVEVLAAEEMMEALDNKVLGDVKKAIAQAKSAFAALPAEEQARRKEQAKDAMRRLLVVTPDSESVECPACELSALLRGKQITSSDPVLVEDQILVRTNYLPTELQCLACGLKLENHSQVHAADRGGQYSAEHSYDPSEYYGIEFDPADSFEPDYGND